MIVHTRRANVRKVLVSIHPSIHPTNQPTIPTNQPTDQPINQVFKSPIDQPMKKSKKGRLTLHRLDGSQGPRVDAVLAEDTEVVGYMKDACKVENG